MIPAAALSIASLLEFHLSLTSKTTRSLLTLPHPEESILASTAAALRVPKAIPIVVYTCLPS